MKSEGRFGNARPFETYTGWISINQERYPYSDICNIYTYNNKYMCILLVIYAYIISYVFFIRYFNMCTHIYVYY